MSLWSTALAYQTALKREMARSPKAYHAVRARATRFSKRTVNHGLVVDQSDRPDQVENRAPSHFPKILPRALYLPPAVCQLYAHCLFVTELKAADLEGDLERSHRCALAAHDQGTSFLYYRGQTDP